MLFSENEHRKKLRKNKKINYEVVAIKISWADGEPKINHKESSINHWFSKTRDNYQEWYNKKNQKACTTKQPTVPIIWEKYECM